ncbi:MAG: metallophosphoesterase family protein [Lachnospiraceae bacterium]|nr:metallophosphoesterase family protein [Lachnospiraceae bacterium]
MGYEKRLDTAFEQALVLPIFHNSKLVLISDCHRGIGNSNDNFLKNQHLYFAALTYYYDKGYTYIELGDGDELWENRSLEQIKEIHGNVFCLLSSFFQKKRLYMIYGNHDMEKKDNNLSLNYPVYEGIILKDCCSDKFLYLTHGHQADTLNSVFWKLSRFLVRYLWKPLEQFGVLDPTSAAKNYSVKEKTEKRLTQWAKEHDVTIITGHTHRPVLDIQNPYYCNTGSCVHPKCITCLEIQNGSLLLVKWSVETKEDLTLTVARTVLSGPLKIKDLS